MDIVPDTLTGDLKFQLLGASSTKHLDRRNARNNLDICLFPPPETSNEKVQDTKFIAAIYDIFR